MSLSQAAPNRFGGLTDVEQTHKRCFFFITKHAATGDWEIGRLERKKKRKKEKKKKKKKKIRRAEAGDRKEETRCVCVNVKRP